MATVDQAWFPRATVDNKRAEVAAVVRKLWEQQRSRQALATWPALTFHPAKADAPGRRRAGEAARADPPRRRGSARGGAALDALPRVKMEMKHIVKEDEKAEVKAEVSCSTSDAQRPRIVEWDYVKDVKIIKLNKKAETQEVKGFEEKRGGSEASASTGVN